MNHNCINIYICYSKMNTFDWNLVRTLLAVLEQGSLLGASRVLKLSQPTVGRQVAELERQLGISLFERSGRGLTPTASALLLADAARSMESGALQLAQVLRSDLQDASGTVRLTASTPVATYLMPPLLARMREALPGIAIELVASNTVKNLLRREADIAIRMVRPEQNNLIARKIGEVRLGAYASKRYLARRGMPRQPADLLKHDLIAGDSDTAVLEGLRKLGHPVDLACFALRCDDLAVQWQSVIAGLGIGFAGAYLARSEPDVAPVLEGALKIPPLPMWLAVHRELRSSPRIRSVYDFLAAELPRHL